MLIDKSLIEEEDDPNLNKTEWVEKMKSNIRKEKIRQDTSPDKKGKTPSSFNTN